MFLAARTTQVAMAASTDDVTISVDAIRVYGMIISNATVSDIEVDIQETDGTSIFQVAVRGNTSYIIDIPFIADNGLQVDGNASFSANITVTAFHTNPGD